MIMFSFSTPTSIYMFQKWSLNTYLEARRQLSL
ncbi:unnamed protein product [Acanthoscelides obtectus]|uniref:Uncharacterized protein n=1 Tax=Acanthoscelides obtectus TaxID=200917 RepID=A0A9P0KSR9_ACAOB|nr:unnamed protein product [Acanthoscelides obtectus]CAK1625174.1 hypothetical protein AOBTE_LOCUS3007 [Acanthoscelides obtectus]